MRIQIEGRDLPATKDGPQADALRLANVHVGVQRAKEVVDRYPAWADKTTWHLAITSREVDGLLDVGGDWVHGRPGARFLYLSWGNVTGTTFEMFRRAKLMFTDIPTDLLRAAHDGNDVLTAGLGLTDLAGGPICARVRPPAITWSLQ
ncbi:DUF5990 family protein [Actinoplanes solisilvae]|uniref:DUF5990 family protein n=1 Tax=Actinoplanes solisilvae TaxID=2486853 RepID=UPI000FD980EA|nr:DUF5990 family protein [Actinoplanes solisilvae]